MACGEMSLSPTDPVIFTLCLVGAVRSLAEVLALRILVWTSEAWNTSIYWIYTIPPFPMIIDLVLEPHIYAALDSHISSPCCVKILFNHSVCRIHIGQRRHGHCSIDLPIVNMSGWLCWLRWKTQINWLRKGCACKFWDSNCSTNATWVCYAISDCPRALRCGACWLLESEGSRLIERVAIVLGQNQAGLGDLLDYTVLELSDVCHVYFSGRPVVILESLQVYILKAIIPSSLLVANVIEEVSCKIIKIFNISKGGIT